MIRVRLYPGRYLPFSIYLHIQLDPVHPNISQALPLPLVFDRMTTPDLSVILFPSADRCTVLLPERDQEISKGYFT